MHDTQDHQHTIRTKENQLLSDKPYVEKICLNENVAGTSPSAPKAPRNSRRRRHMHGRLHKRATTTIAFAKPARLACATAWVLIWHVPCISAFPQTTGPPPLPPKPPDTPCSGCGGEILGRSILCAVWPSPGQLHHDHQQCFRGKTLVLCQWPVERLHREEVRRPRLPNVDRLRLRWARPNQGRGRTCWS